jgi:hypothetical protein
VEHHGCGLSGNVNPERLCDGRFQRQLAHHMRVSVEATKVRDSTLIMPHLVLQ